MDHAPPPPDPGSCLEVRLFYVRLSPHGGAAPPPRLALELRPAAGGEAIHLALRLDRHDAASGEATYVSTAAARLAPPAAAFEVADHRGAALLRGSLRRCCPDAKAADSPAWEINCVPAAGAAASASAFEVYVAGCCAGEPAVLTRALRLATPEEAAGGLVRRRPGALTAAGNEGDNDMNTSSMQYPEGWYSDDDDGQLSWFNAGVRVGVGIGLGVCVGVGIGVGLLMRSYQATTRSLKRRFF
ncbi:hypothetical protein PAHAL_6G032600 [Panicum hallii]|uniref:Uncharacterized protein n=1 Tax=Panicum hallii TaxID=206008 RepID=A0A2S3I059_9POAL|nr:uncharacterized protein At1g01500-like [Panicum hallii]XP_025820664.1 uncharacterized protein At1g01500-like [Panicum hallii]PAN33601.1 hypothetical protein PAHAL_6G032600 [Panicum hallii]